MEFNTLDAQRDACEAYILSQRGEGWAPSPQEYDDGGFSGGNLERPALKRLLEDIKAGKIQIVVVYKIDRLTRSLTDFSKLVEVFDEYGVTFVSVTQSFNTTTSMGRLTLNVLLSFAQFEREVTGERIRDKIEASKRKGMWVGGKPPIGYRIENRRLVIEEKEVDIARFIFERYLALGNVRALKAELDQKGIVSPVRQSLTGKTYGGAKISRGALYAILKNPAYIGKVPHKEKSYEGLHKGIIDPDMWQAVQERLKQNTYIRQKRTIRKYVLKGLLYDLEGTIYSPVYTKRHNREYSYYISQNLLQYKNHPRGILARIPCHEIEKRVKESLRQETENICADIEPSVLQHILDNQHEIPEDMLVRSCIEKVIVDMDSLKIKIKPKPLKRLVEKHLKLGISERGEVYEISVPFKLKKMQYGTQVIEPEGEQRDIFDLPPSSLKKLVQGIIWRDDHFKGASLKQIARQEGCSEAYVGTAIYQSLEFPN